MPRSSRFNRLWLALALLSPSPVLAQVEVASVPLIYDNPAHLGQAQSSRACLSNNDTGNMEVLAPLGGGGASGSIPGIGIAPFMAETTDGFVVMTGMSAIVKRTKLGQFVTSKDYNPFLVQVGPVLPLPGGEVLVAVDLALRTFDGSLNEIASFPTAMRDGFFGTVVGLARRGDGVVFTCERTVTGAYRLTAYGSAGGAIWDVPIPAGGPIALCIGRIYVGHSSSSLDVYASNGATMGSWSGPPGNPLSNIIDVTSSTTGDLLFTLTGAAGGPLRVFSVPPVSTVRKTWGEAKAAFR